MIKGKLLTEISIVWCADDVRHVAEQKNITLTDEQVSDVLYLMQDRHDATIGMSWDIIDYLIDDVLEG
jgi:hypothetical protein